MSVKPTRGSRWKHTNGNVYTVITLANEASTKPDYVPSVVYCGNNGNVWSRPLSDWHRSMTLVDASDNLVSKAKPLSEGAMQAAIQSVLGRTTPLHSTDYAIFRAAEKAHGIVG